VAVACARLGVPSLFVGMLGRDRFGDFILDELASHGVDVSHVMRTDEAKTALAFVSRDASEESYLQARLASGAVLIVITDDGEPVTAVTARARLSVAPPKVRVVDTTAAGDAFIGDLLSRLVDARLTRSTLSAWTADEARMRESLEFATRCGAFTVTRPGSYAALPRREDLAALRG